MPTPFSDREGWPVDDAALRTYVRFLVDNGLHGDRATLLAGGAAGDFSTMTFDERVHVASVVIDEAGGRVPVAMGAQTTSTLELVRLARAAQSLGAHFIQVSCPFYFEHGEDDFEEFVREAAAAAPEVGIIVYNTFWTSSGLSFAMVERLAEIPNVVGLKWATPRTDAMEFEDVTSRFSDRFTIIDNNLYFAFSPMPALGARAFEVHLCNFWPEWGIRLLDEVQARNYPEIARIMVEEAMPFYKLWVSIEREYTSGDGYLDKLCMELVGLPSSRLPAADARRARPLPGGHAGHAEGHRMPAARRARAGRRGVTPTANMVVMAPGDNVGIATRDIAAGEFARALGGREQAASERIPLGHKIALVDITPDAPIMRFGVPVGVAIAPVAAGCLVHVHNVASRYFDNDEDHHE